MADIYEQHRAAFARVSAYVILGDDGRRVATVALKFPADGAGRLYAYVHWIGDAMVRGFASGGGYDKRSAACAAAADKLPASHTPDRDYGAFRQALRLDDGYDWTRSLEARGFRVFQAV